MVLFKSLPVHYSTVGSLFVRPICPLPKGNLANTGCQAAPEKKPSSLDSLQTFCSLFSLHQSRSCVTFLTFLFPQMREKDQKAKLRPLLDRSKSLGVYQEELKCDLSCILALEVLGVDGLWPSGYPGGYTRGCTRGVHQEELKCDLICILALRGAGSGWSLAFRLPRWVCQRGGIRKN